MHFVQVTYVQRTRDVSVFVWCFTFVCTAYQAVCATYVCRMKRTRDVSTAYAVCSFYLNCVSFLLEIDRRQAS